MWGIAAKYATIFFSSMIKFLGGPVAGAAFKTTILETAVFTALGAMTSIVIFSYVGDKYRVYVRKRNKARNKKKRVFTKSRRRIVRIYSKFGLTGVSILTPLLLTPIGGTIVALSFGEPKKRIILYMLPSCFIWAFIITITTNQFWASVCRYLGKC